MSGLFVLIVATGAGLVLQPGGPETDPSPAPVLATVDDLAAEVARLKAMLEAFGVDVESPPPAAELEALETLERAGYDVRPMSEAERLAIARRLADERRELERAREDQAIAERIAGAVDELRRAGYLVEQRADPVDQAPEIAEAPPAYAPGQGELLAATINRNRGLQAHPALMQSAQRLAEYHAATGRWAHSTNAWRGNDKSENIAHSSSGVGGLVTLWVRSPGHRRNWDTPRRWVGVGVARTASGHTYGVQHFSNAAAPSLAAAGPPTLKVGVRRVARRGLFFRRRRR